MTVPSSIVSVAITAATTQPTQAGFGTPLIMSFHTNFPERVRSYTSLAGMLADGFVEGDAAYEAASAILSQSPRPPTIKIGREVNSATKSIVLTPVAVNDTLYQVIIQNTTYQYLSDATALVAEICAGLEAAIDAVAWVNATPYVLYDHVTNGGNVYRCTTAGTSAGAGGPTGTGTAITDNTVVWRYVGPNTNVEATDGGTTVTVAGDAIANWFALEVEDKTLITRKDATTDAGGVAGIANDIAAVSLIDDDWYALILTRQAEAVINAAAAYIETVDKILLAGCGDDEIYAAATTTDVASDLMGNNYAKTACFYHNNPESFPEAAWAGKCLPRDPGSITWMFWVLTGIIATKLSTTQVTALDNKRCSYYRLIASISLTINGLTADGEYIDVRRGIDWTVARIGEQIFADLANADKIPFTDQGISIPESEVKSVLQDGIASGFLAADPAPVVTVPRAADVSDADKAGRVLPDIAFTARIAGAIHKVEVEGVISL